MKNKLYYFLIAFLLIGCGYKPASYYSKEWIHGGVSVEVEALPSDPENSVIVRDALNEALVTRFKGSVVRKDLTTTHIKANMGTISFSALQYDDKGYVVFYRTNVSLKIVLEKEGIIKHFSTSGVYDFPIEPNSVISDSKRFEAIKQASLKALDAFVAQVGVAGIIKNDNR